MEFYFDEFALHMVALRGLVVFPGAVVHFDVGRKQSISAIKEAMTAKKDIFLVDYPLLFLILLFSFHLKLKYYLFFYFLQV